MAVPVIESQTSNTSGGSTATTLALTKPSGVATDDLLLVIVGSDANAGEQWLAETGWTHEINYSNSSSDTSFSVFWRIADGTEPSSTTFDHDSSEELYGWYLRISGADTSAPIDVKGTPPANISGSSKAISGVTTTVDDCLAFYVLAFDGGDGAPFSVSGTGWSEGGDISSGTGAADASGTWGTKSQTTAGATGTATVTPSVTDGASGVQFAIAPPSAVSITAQDATHSHSADSPAITQTHVIASADSTHGHTADNVTVDTNNASPTVALNTADATDFGTDGTPTLEFTGSDTESDDIRYNIQIAQDTAFTTSGGSIDSYSESNQNTLFAMQQGFRKAVGQSFTGDGSLLSEAEFYLRKSGTPTGNIYARIYAHTGTFGTSGTPTGSALASSDAFDVSTLTGTFGMKSFSFTGSDRITLTNATNYFVVLDVDGVGDGSNFVELGTDDSSPSHGGNAAVDTGSWSADSSNDACFDVISSGSVVIDKVSGTDAGFVNTVSGGDTDPFNAGEKVSYTVQGADELDGGTWYWRARGIDPTGSNTYGSYPTHRSFDITASVSITSQDATHSHTADSPVITQTHEIVSTDSTHSHTADNVTVGVTVSVTAQDATHTHTADATAITQTHVIGTDESSHTHTADSPVITQTHVISTNDSNHSHTADNITISQVNSIVAEDSSHGHTADEPAVSQTHVISTAESSHAHTADNVTITQTHSISVEDSTHSHTADNVTVTIDSVAITPQSSTHSHAADNIAITQTHIISVDGSTHTHSTDSPPITQTHIISTDESSHGHTASQPTVSAGNVVVNIVAQDATHSHKSSIAVFSDAQTIAYVPDATISAVTMTVGVTATSTTFIGDNAAVSTSYVGDDSAESTTYVPDP